LLLVEHLVAVEHQMEEAEAAALEDCVTEQLLCLD
jgi:hypothetical protein